MILYQLKCAGGHGFEAWFRDSAAYDRQAKRGQVECPVCSSSAVDKAPMAPRIAAKRSSTTEESPTSPEARAREVAREILIAMGKMRKQVEGTCEDVGERFAEEARAIHYGEAEERGIFGEATKDEVIQLKDEDIPIHFLGVKRPKHS